MMGQTIEIRRGTRWTIIRDVDDVVFRLTCADCHEVTRANIRTIAQFQSLGCPHCQGDLLISNTSWKEGEVSNWIKN